MVSPGDLGRADRRRGRDVRHPRRLRPRHRHPVSVRQERKPARPDDALDRAVSGTATRPGWCSAAADCWWRFRSPMSIIMPAFYLPMIVMLLALVFRGVAFEFRIVSYSKTWWNFAFTAGSTLAAFSQGIILGALIQGVSVENGAFAGGHFDWATPFAFLCGVALVVGLCAARRDLADHEDRRRGRRTRARAGQGAADRGARLHAGGLSLHAARLRAHRRSAGSRCRISISCGRCRWSPRSVAFGAWRWIERRGATSCRSSPAIGLFLLGYLGLVISSYPYIVPPSAHGVGGGRRALEPDLHADRHACSCCRSSSATSCSCIGCSAARCARARAITEPSAPAFGVCGAACACGRIMPQPTRSNGNRPCTGRSKARGISGNQIGKARLDLGRRGAGAVGRVPQHDRALFGDVLLGGDLRTARGLFGEQARAGSASSPPPARRAARRPPPLQASGRCAARNCR